MFLNFTSSRACTTDTDYCRKRIEGQIAATQERSEAKKMEARCITSNS